ncbi:MAG: acyl-CoA dehydrogenase family protein [Gammaproteobacteria bacterium]
MSDAFRDEVRAWLQAHCPPSMRVAPPEISHLYGGGRRAKAWHPDQPAWCASMASRGWTVPEWPVEYGGAGLSREQVAILREEMRRIGAQQPLFSFGISMLSPVLFKFGNDDQRRRFLPDIARGALRWCQGYSEPNSGSDLASLMTRAEDQGDHYLVNGQKIWTSYGDEADWMFCLVRTNTSVPKHEGISFVLFDMNTPGVTVRPIKLISGASPFCEVFFENVRVAKENRVGEEGQGWAIATYLLSHEREMISSLGKIRHDTDPGRRALDIIGTDESGRLRNASLRQTLARYQLDAAAFRLWIEHGERHPSASAGMGAMSSAVKYYGTELNKRRNELYLDIEGAEALLWDARGPAGEAWARNWLRSKGNSIEGGTSEIQLNIIAKRVLGLP